MSKNCARVSRSNKGRSAERRIKTGECGLAAFSPTACHRKSRCLEQPPLLMVKRFNPFQERRLRMDISCFWRNRQLCHLFALRTRLQG
ncbi:MAG: hypothetical protein JSR13_03520 [Proteobacteria bacterium]|nr:hypothetical protein [Pseudomonadota bacterium]